MRIATANAYDAQIDSMQRRQQELYEAQTQLSTGLRVTKASDDPSAAARAERALASISRTEATQRAVDASHTAMSLTESALSDASNLMQQAREAIVAAGNPTYTDAERDAQAKQIRAIRTQLLDVANRADASGSYIFGGQGATAPPFIDQPGGVAWRGVAGEVRVSADEQLPTAIDGQSAWMQGRTGNGVFVTSPSATNTGAAWIDAGSVSDAQALTGASYQVVFGGTPDAPTYSVLKNGTAMSPTPTGYTSGQQIVVDGQNFSITGRPAAGDKFNLTPSTPTLSVFDVLDRTATQLETPLRSNGAITQGTTLAIRDVDALMGKLSSTRSAVGETLQRIDNASGRLDAAKLASQTEQSDATDLDTAQAISAYKTKESSYDAALKSYGMIQRLSLFNYING